MIFLAFCMCVMCRLITPISVILSVFGPLAAVLSTYCIRCFVVSQNNHEVDAVDGMDFNRTMRWKSNLNFDNDFFFFVWNKIQLKRNSTRSLAFRSNWAKLNGNEAKIHRNEIISPCWMSDNRQYGTTWNASFDHFLFETNEWVKMSINQYQVNFFDSKWLAW